MTAPDEDIPIDVRERVDAELDTMARGNLGVRGILRDSLRRFADGDGGPELREASKDILAGRIGARRALASNVYGARLHEGLSRFRDHYERLSPEQRRELRESGREQIRRRADEER